MTLHLSPSVISFNLSISLFITRTPFSGISSAYLRNECLMSSMSLKKSRWSASTFKMIPAVGWNFKKLFVYSQASVMKFSEWPMRIFPPIASRIPPTDIAVSYTHLLIRNVM